MAPPFISDNDLSHMTNWLDCLRSRQQPNATVRDGFAHSVAVIMAARAYREGFLHRAETNVTLPGNSNLAPPFISDNDLSHMTNWLDCLRSRQQPNATVRDNPAS